MMTNIKLSYVALLFLGLSIVTSCDKKKEQKAENVEEAVKTEVANAAETVVAPAEFAAFKFDETSHEFGNIKQGDSVMHTFSFSNTGSVPLIISKARGSCGCTVPKYPTEPIPVGGQAEILVKFNSRGKKGAQNKTVTLTANTDPQNTILTISSFVEVPEAK